MNLSKVKWREYKNLYNDLHWIMCIHQTLISYGHGVGDAQISMSMIVTEHN